MSNSQMRLPLGPPPPRPRYRERPELYEAVRRLRRVGMQVFRSGRLHKVNGRLLTSRDLQRLAAAFARDGKGREGGHEQASDE